MGAACRDASGSLADFVCVVHVQESPGISPGVQPGAAPPRSEHDRPADGQQPRGFPVWNDGLWDAPSDYVDRVLSCGSGSYSYFLLIPLKVEMLLVTFVVSHIPGKRCFPKQRSVCQSVFSSMWNSK